MTEIYLHFLFAHYGLYGNAPVVGAQLARLRFPRPLRPPRCNALRKQVALLCGRANLAHRSLTYVVLLRLAHIYHLMPPLL